MSKQFALSTSDNPWNPITHFDQWFEYDVKEKHYNTCEYLGRIALTSGDLSDADYDETIENAIDEIVKTNLIGTVTDFKVKYIKVTS